MVMQISGYMSRVRVPSHSQGGAHGHRIHLDLCRSHHVAVGHLLSTGQPGLLATKLHTAQPTCMSNTTY